MKLKIFKYFLLIIISICAGFTGAIAFYRAYIQPELANLHYTASPPVAYTNSMYLPTTADGRVDFVTAANKSRPAVVYIKVLSTSRQQSFGWDPFWDFFGNVGPVSSSGSGVIVSEDGYIITNSHVVDNATKIEIVMNNNKRSYPATVVGVDASTDLALLKIESAAHLPYLNFTNSDKLQIGEWVVAVGNPFNLTSTVTAGIVSAKGRNINIVQNQFPIESFIQTDAAINPGNSGGALVNLEGDLVGINTAILSKTGSYNGYGFAIPANIVRKVISDLKEFGYVQRAFIEADITDIDERLAEELDDNMQGVHVRAVFVEGNAAKAGLKSGDIIIKIDERMIDSRAIMDEQIAYHRPGDKVPVVVRRGKEVKEFSILLTNKRGTTSLEKTKTYHSDYLGADFEEISKIEKEKYGIQGGIRLFNFSNGQIRRMNLPDGFVLQKYNGKTYQDPQALISDMEKTSGRIQIEGINPNGSRGMYSFYVY